MSILQSSSMNYGMDNPGDGARLMVAVHDQGQMPTPAAPRGFNPAEPVTVSGTPVVDSSLGIDGAGNMTIVYRVGEGWEPWKVYVRYRPARGAWGAPQALVDPTLKPLQSSNSGTWSDDPKRIPGDLGLVVAPSGRAIISTDAGLWERAPGAGAFTAVPGTSDVKRVAMNARGDVAAVTYSAGPNPWSVTYSVKVRPAGGVWSAPRVLGLVWANDEFFDFEPRSAIAITSNGTVATAWVNGGPDPGDDRYGGDGNALALRTPGASFGSGTWSAPRRFDAWGGVGPSGATLLPLSAGTLRLAYVDYTGNKGKEETVPGTGVPDVVDPRMYFVTVSPGAKGRSIGIDQQSLGYNYHRVGIAVRSKAGAPYADRTTLEGGYRETYGRVRAGLDDEGNAFIMWMRAVYDDTNKPFEIGIAGYDTVSPLIRSATASAAPKVGQPVSFAATATDRMSAPRLTWTFGDGTPAVTGATATHTYAKAGTYTAKVNAKDEAGNSASWPKTVVVIG